MADQRKYQPQPRFNHNNTPQSSERTDENVETELSKDPELITHTRVNYTLELTSGTRIELRA